MAGIDRIINTALFLFVLCCPAAAVDGGIDFGATEWDTGPLEYGVVVEKVVDVRNGTDLPVVMDLVSTCSCLSVSEDSIRLGPGGRGSFTLYFDSSDDEGEFEKILIIQTDSEAMPKGFFIVRGSVETGEAASGGGSEPQRQDGPAETEDVQGGSPLIQYFYTSGCKSCNEFLRKAELPIEKFDITDAVNFELMHETLAAKGVSLREVPVMITRAAVYQGEREVIGGYSAVLKGAEAAPAEISGEDSADTAGLRVSLALLPVIAAGLLDGVNPCAFTTLIFLLSALAVAGRSRRETLLIGIFFTLTVFLTYFLIGLGFFRIIRIADSFELVSRIIRWGLVAVLIVFAGLSFYDYSKIRAGRAKDIILQLPDGVKRRMHSSIRSYSKSAALAGSSVVMGVLISVFELGCTGQIYFPTITYIIQTDRAASGYLFLALYNLAFILPLAGVFVVVYFGITSKKITKKFQSNLGMIKLLTAFLFLCFAALMFIL